MVMYDIETMVLNVILESMILTQWKMKVLIPRIKFNHNICLFLI